MITNSDAKTWLFPKIWLNLFMLFLSCFCYAFVRVCLLMPCGHLLGKGWPLGSSLWCLIVKLSLPIGILGQVWCLIVSIPDLCPIFYFNFLDLDLSITNGIVSSKIYDKRDDFNFEISNSPFLDGDVPRSPFCGVYILQLIRFARQFVLMLMTSTTETHFWHIDNKVISTINFVKLFLNFITDSQSWLLNTIFV